MARDLNVRVDLAMTSSKLLQIKNVIETNCMKTGLGLVCPRDARKLRFYWYKFVIDCSSHEMDAIDSLAKKN